MNMNRIVLFSTVALMLACSSPKKKSNTAQGANQEDFTKMEVLTDAQRLVASIEKAHRKDLFELNEAVQFDLKLEFGGTERINGRVYLLTGGSKVKIEDVNGLQYWDGSKAMVLPNQEDNEKARFDLLTWSYFFAAPYKLSDSGVNHEFIGETLLGGAEYRANKMTFEKGIGDTPEDWYIVYKDRNSDLLAAMAYIVTSGEKTVEEAEKDPHVITYEAYTEVGGIPFATQWNFWTWNEAGEMNKLLGSATVSNIEFTEKAGDMFQLTASLAN